MKRTEVTVLSINDDATTHAKRVRLNATKYVRSVIEDTGASQDIDFVYFQIQFTF